MSQNLTVVEWVDFWYHKVGVNVIPVISRNKGHPEKGFGKIKYTNYPIGEKNVNFLLEPIPENILEQWKSSNLFDDGMAIVGGRVWRGVNAGKYLIMIDLDNGKAIAEVFPKGLDDAKTKTLIEQHLDMPHKAHVYYYSTKSATKKSSTQADPKMEHAINNNEVPLIEVKGEGSHGIHVVTPSIHSDGSPYEIVSYVSEPAVFDGDIEVYIDQICRKYDIPYLMDEYMKNSKIPIDKLTQNGYKVSKGGGRRPALLRVLESFYRVNQYRLTDPNLKEEGLQYGMNWNKEHTEEPLDTERVVYQNNCAWDYITRLNKDGRLYPITQTQKDTRHVIDTTADMIMTNYRFKTFRDNDETLVYVDGVYKMSHADSLIREETEKHIANCDSHSRFEVLSKIKVQTYIDRTQFDTDNKLIIFLNGILNISTLEFTPHDPSILSTIKIPVEWIPLTQQDDPFNDLKWEQIIEFIGDTLFYKYLTSCFTNNISIDKVSVYTCLEVFASTMLKNSSFTRATMMIGSGSNGKSVFINYITKFIGEQNVSNVSINDMSDDKFALAELFGKLLNVFADIESNELQHSGRLKVSITDVGDEIRAQRKHQQPFKFRNIAKFIFSANRFPTVPDQTDGFFRRFLILKWNRQFTGKERDPMLLHKMESNDSEKSKLLQLLVVMARRLQVRGSYMYEQTTKDIRTEWNRLANPVKMFIDQCIINTDDEKDFLTSRDAHNAYTEFCLDSEIHPMSQISFGRNMNEFFESVNKRTQTGIVKGYTQLKLRKKEQTGLKEFET